MIGLEAEGRFEFVPVMACPFDDVCHVDLSGGESEYDESENAMKRM